VSSNGYPALRGGIKVPFFRESHDLLNNGKIKASYLSPMFKILGPDHHARSPALLHQEFGPLFLFPPPPNARGHRELPKRSLSDFSEPQQGSDAVQRVVRP